MTMTETVAVTPKQEANGSGNGNGNGNGSGNGTALRSVDWDNPRVSAILQAAATCFARKGFSATTLAEIGKELGLRKSIVHYYFASKAALIHEVQSFSYNKYLARIREAMSVTDGSSNKATSALRALWESLNQNQTGTGLNIEVWSAARRDPELKRRAGTLQRDARQVIGTGLSEVLGANPDQIPGLQGLSTLVLAVLNGLSVSEYLEGDEARVKEAYETFLKLLWLGLESSRSRTAS